MKKQRILGLVSAILALSILVSCAPQSASKVSSAMIKNENESSMVSSVSSTSSQSTIEQEDGLSMEKVNEISACIKKDNYEYQRGQYFGTFNQYDIVLISQIDGVEYRDAQVMKIDEYGFFIGDTEKLIAYKDNSYILLSEAYSKGIVTKADIQNIQHVYGEYYSEFNNERFDLVVKKDANNPYKKYTVADFPTIKIEKIIQSRWSSNELGHKLTIALPIYNKRNLLNAIREIKKLDYVLSVIIDYPSDPE